MSNDLLLTGAAINGVGNALDNLIRGNAPANRLSGQDGADRLEGGAGADTLLGGAGADTLAGGIGNDVLQYLTTSDVGDRITDFGTVVGDNDRFIFEDAAFPLFNGWTTLALREMAVPGGSIAARTSFDGPTARRRGYGERGRRAARRRGPAPSRAASSSSPARRRGWPRHLVRPVRGHPGGAQAPVLVAALSGLSATSAINPADFGFV